MLKTYEAILNNGQLTWLDTPPIAENAKVYVTVMERQLSAKQDSNPRRIGMSAGKATLPDDINKYDDEVAKLFGVQL